MVIVALAERIAAGKEFQVRVVTVVVLGDGVAEPGQIAGGRCGVRLLVSQRGIGRHLFGEPAHQEVELDVRRLLTPQRAVVVEDGDAFFAARPAVADAPTKSTIADLVGPSFQDSSI